MLIGLQLKIPFTYLLAHLRKPFLMNCAIKAERSALILPLLRCGTFSSLGWISSLKFMTYTRKQIIAIYPTGNCTHFNQR